MTVTQKQEHYTAADGGGVYVDGARGVHMVDRIVQIAEAYGFQPGGCDDDECPRCAHDVHEASDGTYTEWSYCMFAGELADDASDYMNEACPVDGFYWGFCEGDWGLWQQKEEDRTLWSLTCNRCGRTFSSSIDYHTHVTQGCSKPGPGRKV